MAEAMPVGARFFRGHGLGNDYLVFERMEGSDASGSHASEDASGCWTLEPHRVRAICRRGEGVGSDGIVLLLDRAPADGIFPLRMFNPDGSEFERSGNGLRVLGAYLLREELISTGPFEVRTGGSRIRMRAHGREPNGEFDLSVELGRARFGPRAGILDEAGAEKAVPPFFRLHHFEKGPIDFVPVWVGNPHAVVFTEGDPDSSLSVLGPFLTGHPAFPSGTNVQLAKVLEPSREGSEHTRIRIGIWERGVGKTSASGTSSCAAVVAAVGTGKAPPGAFVVEMEGGVLRVEITPELELTLRGPVREVSEGCLTEGFLRSLRSSPGT